MTHGQVALRKNVGIPTISEARGSSLLPPRQIFCLRFLSPVYLLVSSLPVFSLLACLPVSHLPICLPVCLPSPCLSLIFLPVSCLPVSLSTTQSKNADAMGNDVKPGMQEFCSLENLRETRRHSKNAQRRET